MYNDGENPFDEFNRSNDKYDPISSFWSTTRYWVSFSLWQWGGKFRNATYKLREFAARISSLVNPAGLTIAQTLTPAQVSLLPGTTRQGAHSLFLQTKIEQFNNTGQGNCAVTDNGEVKDEADRMANGDLPPWKRTATKWYLLLWVLLAILIIRFISKRKK